MSLHDPTHKLEGELSPTTRRIAMFFSVVFQPMFVPLPVILLLNSQITDVSRYVLVSLVNILFMVIVPSVDVYYFALKGDNKDGDIPNREERYIPMLIGIASYALAIVTGFMMDAPMVTCAFMTSYVIATAVLLLITTRWKISLHAVGLSGPATILTLAFWPWGLLAFLIIPFVEWSRYVLKKHTPAQLAAGTVAGIVITVIVYALMVGF